MGIINFFKKTYEKIGIAYLWEGVYIYIYILMFYNNFNKKKFYNNWDVCKNHNNNNNKKCTFLDPLKHKLFNLVI